jgi:hypothetical protein
MSKPIHVVVDPKFCQITEDICKEMWKHLGDVRVWLILDPNGRHDDVGIFRHSIPPCVKDAHYILYDSGQSLGALTPGPDGWDARQFRTMALGAWECADDLLKKRKEEE